MIEYKEYKLTLFSDRIIKVPYYKIQGKSSTGKSVFITSFLHGNDINSLNLVKNFFKVIKTLKLNEKIIGTLYIFPIINIVNFIDVNTSSDSKIKYELLLNIIDELTYIFFRKCDFGINFFDSQNGLLSIPHIIVSDDSFLDYAKNFGTKVVLINKTHFVNTLFNQKLFSDYGIRLFNIEIGEKSVIYPNLIKPLIQNIKFFLVNLGMLNIDDVHTSKKISKQIIIRENQILDYKLEQDSLVKLKIKPGYNLKNKEIIGRYLTLPDLKLHIISAFKEGKVFSVNTNNLISKNCIVYSVIDSEN